MWILESSDNIFQGKRLWLRPGKRYLFGRTVAEAGQLAISDKGISRKHLTIEVDPVPDGASLDLHARSRVTVEDLNTKRGTLLNGDEIRGQRKVLADATNHLRLGGSTMFQITWKPVILTYSLTGKELRQDPWTKRRAHLEQLDIKLTNEYEQLTSYVISKKRNTPKGLQALIGGKGIVVEDFTQAIVAAASVPEGSPEGSPSPLELDYTANWPNALDYLPPRSEEPTDRPAESYAPDKRRKEIFDGYTFIFYDKKQWENLLPAITAGRGKALYKEVVPGQTEIDDFISYVKGLAGEQGLGEFEDGSEGRGVVVVRHSAAKGQNDAWLRDFLIAVAQRLDHRPIDQREFLEAILTCDAAMLRRALEAETQPTSMVASPVAPAAAEMIEPVAAEPAMDVDESNPVPPRGSEPAVQPPPPAPARRGRPQRSAASRFRGFDFDDPPSEDPPKPASKPAAPNPKPAPAPEPPSAQAPALSQDSLFVSQNPAPLELMPEQEEMEETPRSLRKRARSPVPARQRGSLMDTLAPAAAAAKRRRIEAGEEPVPLSPPPPPPPPPPKKADERDTGAGTATDKTSKGANKGRNKPMDTEQILELARQRREDADARAEVERRELEEMPEGGLDYARIRAMHIIEECEVHFPSEDHSRRRTVEHDVADGRWDPRWNGRKNFKRFRRQGEAAGRPPQRIIIGLEEVRPKEYGIGDEYWLQNQSSSKSKDGGGTPSQQGGPTQQSKPASTAASRRRQPASTRRALDLDSSDEDEPGQDEEENAMEGEEEEEEEDRMEVERPRSKTAKAAEKANARRSQAQSQTSHSQTPASSSARGSKRTATAAGASARGQAAKRPRRGLISRNSDKESEDDSGDELKFRFGRRR